jgi:serine phosphatase RsbU (regulator of sigma subunit)
MSFDVKTLIRNYTIRLLSLFFIVLMMSCSTSNSGPDRTVKFVVHLQDSITVQQVYLTGSTDQLGNWDPGYLPMKQESDSVWSATLSFKDGETIEYKITAGLWWTQALNQTQNMYDNFKLHVNKDTILSINVYGWLNRMVNGRLLLDEERFHPKHPEVTLDGLWKYHPGDDSTWASPGYNDSSWVETDPFITWEGPSAPEWKGIGWFRFHMYVDSSLWNRTLAIRIHQLGASQIYYNGCLLYGFGKIGESESTTVDNAMNWWQEFKIDPQKDQLLAVRYANYDRKKLIKNGYSPGFLISIRELNNAFHTVADVRDYAVRQTVFTLIPLLLFLLHLMLYIFIRNQRENLFYAICMLGFAGLTYFNYERGIVTDVGRILLYSKLNSLSVSVAILFGLLTIYVTSYIKIPKRVWIPLSIFGLITLMIMFGYGSQLISTLNYVFFGYVIFEFILTFSGSTSKSVYGGWILFSGFLILSIFIILQILVDYSVITDVFGLHQLYAFGMIGLAVFMSMFLSYNYAQINKNLETQLVIVKELSERTLEQERLANKMELERQLIESENERKTNELEEARKLQLSILPKSFPKIPHLEISAQMRTATEVGGDYYDYYLSDDGSITLTIGDATGHGIKAGILVTLIKSLFSTMANTYFIPDFFNHCTKIIKKMNLGNLYMGMTVLKIEKYKVTVSAGGMPPFLIYRHITNSLEEVVLKGMPVGAFHDFNFQQRTLKVATGDVIFLFSDGFIELFNAHGEMIDYEFVKKSFSESAKKNPPEIIKHLLHTADHWLNGAQQNDDITFLVVKIK